MYAAPATAASGSLDRVNTVVTEFGVFTQPTSRDRGGAANALAHDVA